MTLNKKSVKVASAYFNKLNASHESQCTPAANAARSFQGMEQRDETSL